MLSPLTDADLAKLGPQQARQDMANLASEVIARHQVTQQGAQEVEARNEALRVELFRVQNEIARVGADTLIYGAIAFAVAGSLTWFFFKRGDEEDET